jgi:predicted permease
MAAQVAMVVVLLVGGGLLLRSLWSLQRVDLGFDGRRVFTAEMRLLDPRYFDEARLQAFQDQLLSRVRALPGVQQASITSSVPFRGVDWTRSIPHRGGRIVAHSRDVDPDYFPVMGIPLLSGRAFSATDVASAAPVAIVSASLAARMFPNENPLGQRLDEDPKRPLEIVGVVGDVRNLRVESEGEPAYYVPRAQQSSEIICLVVRTTGGAPDLAAAVRAIVKSIDPMQPVMNPTTVEDIVSGTIADRRLFALVTVAFALLTLVLAAAGLYGVTSYGVVARIREIGVRSALGAVPGRLVAMLIAQAMQPVIIGAAVGLVLALTSGRFIERFLFDVRPFDLAAYSGALGWVLALTLIACVVPAARAVRSNPAAALRQE